jgi:hypothetical protein
VRDLPTAALLSRESVHDAASSSDEACQQAGFAVAQPNHCFDLAVHVSSPPYPVCEMFRMPSARDVIVVAGMMSMFTPTSLPIRRIVECLRWQSRSRRVTGNCIDRRTAPSR